MAFLTGAAILGATVLGAGASAYSSAKTAGAAKDTARQNALVAREQYQNNQQALNPYMQSGNEGTQALDNLLSGGQPDWNAYLQSNPDVARAYEANRAAYERNGETLQAFAARHYQEAGKAEGRQLARGDGGEGLRDFQESTGLAPINARIQDAAGGSFDDYQARSGVGGIDAQSDRTIGGSLDEFRRNLGVDQANAASNELLGGGYDAYQQRTGVAGANSALEGSLGLDGGGYDGYLGETKGYNDAIDQFLGIGAGGLPDYLKSAGFDFTLKTGLDAVSSNAATQGLLGSGSTLKALQDRGQDIARTQGQTYLTNLSGVADQRSRQAQDYRTGLAGYSQLREGQAGNYLSNVGAQGARLQGQGIDYLNALGASANRKSEGYKDYTQGLYNLSANQRGQAGDYLNAVSGRSAQGLAAAQALAGVGNTYAGQLITNNNNALQARAGANAAFANGINSTLNNALGAMSYGSSFAPRAA